MFCFYYVLKRLSYEMEGILIYIFLKFSLNTIASEEKTGQLANYIWKFQLCTYQIPHFKEHGTVPTHKIAVFLQSAQFEMFRNPLF